MKVLIPILIGLLVVGCGKDKQSEANNSPSVKSAKELTKKIVGTYQKGSGRYIVRWVFKENQVAEFYGMSEYPAMYEWSIVDGNVHTKSPRHTGIMRVEPNGDLTEIAEIVRGNQRDVPKDKQTATYKKIK